MPVLAITDDFTRAVLEEKDDFGKIPRLMQGRAAFADAADASMAVAGMRILADRGISLKRPDVNALERDLFADPQSVCERLWLGARGCRARAPRAEHAAPRLYPAMDYQWDIRRLHPDATVELKTAEWRTDYTEDADAIGPADEVASDQSLIDEVLGDIAP